MKIWKPTCNRFVKCQAKSTNDRMIMQRLWLPLLLPYGAQEGCGGFANISASRDCTT